jgi:hypothetical protein
VDDLPGKAKGFFANQFFGKNDPFVQQTKQQIAQRLYTIGTNELFDAMFGATDNRFDAADSIEQKKIVLVNTSRARLGEAGSAIFGRYILAQCLAAAFARAAIPEKDRHLAICFVDEVKAYADEQIKTILSDARQFGLGIFMATQAPHQIEKSIRDEIATNTALRLTGNFEDNNLAASLADTMQTTRQAIQSLERKDYAFTEFMTYVRGETKQGAVKLRIPMTTIANEPTMAEPAWEAMRQKNRERYRAIGWGGTRASVTKPLPDTPQPSALTLPPAKSPSFQRPHLRRVGNRLVYIHDLGPIKRAKQKAPYADKRRQWRKAHQQAQRKLPYQLAAQDRKYKKRWRFSYRVVRGAATAQRVYRLVKKPGRLFNRLVPNVGQARSADRYVDRAEKAASAEPAASADKGGSTSK